MQPVYVILPVLNEGAVISRIIEELVKYNYTIVLVDDGSTEDIFSAIKGLPVYYLKHRFNMGQGAALQTGISFALRKGAATFVTFDADGQHDAADIDKMIRQMEEKKADIIFGSRFMSVTPSRITFLRKFLLHFARFLNYLFSGILLSDAHNGLRVFNRKAASSFDILENRMAHATELLIQVKRNRLRYEEFPVHISYTPYSRKKGQKFSHSFKVLQDIILYKLFK
jgi:polyprenyl-phospho-N-acetylgalactosaminyl synthase